MDNVNCRITQNVFADCLTVGAGLHIEMTPGKTRDGAAVFNTIDNNIIWDVRNAEPGTPGQRGCAGSGIFHNASDNLTIANNLIGRCDNAGIFAIVRPDRGGGTNREWIAANNIFAKCKSAIIFLNRENKADGNAYVDMPAQFQGLFEGVHGPNYDPDLWRKITYRDLARWRETLGWDEASVVAHAQIAFDPDTLQLSIASAKALPRVSAVSMIGGDILGRPTGATRVPDPWPS